MSKEEMKELEKKAQRIKTLQGKQRMLQDEIDMLSEDLKVAMEHYGVDEMQVGPFRLIWKLVQSIRFDSKRCRQENPELYALYTKSVSSRPLRLC